MPRLNLLHSPSWGISTLVVLGSFILGQGCAGLRQPSAATRAASGVQIKDQESSLRIEINGQLFSEYHYQGGPRPYLYPVLGPGNLPMTRNWPLKEAADEEKDHPHHKSMWFTHGSVNGVDFWTDGDGKGKIVHETFTRIESGETTGLIQERCKWISPAGKTVLTEDRLLRIQGGDSSRILDFETTLHAVDGNLVFGDTKEGSMAIRVAETMRVKGKVGNGHIVNSQGLRDGETWGKRAAWCDYYGPVDGKVVGVAIFDHPQNPRHPTWWHVRDYGLFAANPFGIHDFEKKPAGTGDLTVKAGETVTFKYRFFFHTGDEKAGRVEEQYREYTSDRTH